ncbi:spermatogenesis-associated protein 17 isoform X1 [Mus musculus]|uniref:Spermatogenesis-associated protein 17 n=3 Tax=Mus musculus TaxID=10090 RepID=SPT17_MOUSE|nr:spermatogenesis-associated protein 17 isoform 1 [Mus musculus]XP_006497270.1 spermatogenesis-associated protein 17 isoform X1 [Mus musculus]XP_036009920.1 spermatogenesis-associated protein 17 isoform X1 [Mus musculus]XP_036009925.1 spermatogenesis-associated protein 17 isoform X1 [Mus musculus]Q9D552.1 RecName: Full=Spermatogenesis-associated protein 17; AltName: Full=Spermatogenesis-related protein 11 [Mus musculus]EDL13051.1 spermatogenesis associated 17 [Mus musculus]BAB29973.1 unnamed|eukprot:NP_083124.1 spermatogenesis-associated protein 17 isoform 1 [Mus musculus]
METNSNNFGELQELKDMATLAKLLARAPFLESQYYFRNRAVDSFRKFENDAAVMIQSWFRGCQVRAYMRHLNRVVTIIQKWWRSYLGRKFYQLVVEAAYYTMKMNLYNEMAVRIQRRWRGFRIRKYCFNYYYLKEYLRAVSETNDAIREALEEFAEMKEREERKVLLEREEKQKDYQARKMHYLLSTKQISGIYNSPFREHPDPWELRLQKAKPLGHQKYTAEKGKTSQSPSNWLACTSVHSFPQSESLPPISRKRCQGPFRDINEVLEQRYKPLEPTLRVAEPINHLRLAREAFKQEERMRNVQDKMFLPFSSYHKKEKYIPMIHSSSAYNSDSYGQKHFRSQDSKKWISDKDFQTVLPSFQLFSKYGKLYSKAGEIV